MKQQTQKKSLSQKFHTSLSKNASAVFFVFLFISVLAYQYFSDLSFSAQTEQTSHVSPKAFRETKFADALDVTADRFRPASIAIPVERRNRNRQPDLPIVSHVAIDKMDSLAAFADQVAVVFQRDPESYANVMRRLQNKTEIGSGLQGYAISYDLAFRMGMLPLIAELARKGEAVFAVVVPDRAHLKLISRFNESLPEGRQILASKSPIHLAKLLRAQRASHITYLTAEEIRIAWLTQVYDQVRQLLESELDEIRNGSVGLSEILSRFADIYNYLYSAA